MGCGWICLGGTSWVCDGTCSCPEEEICTPPTKFGAVGDRESTPCVPIG